MRSGRSNGLSIELPAIILAGKSQNEFTQRWAAPNMDRRMLEDTVARWRNNSGRK